MKRITSLKPGDQVVALFEGSKLLGNEPYSLPLTFEKLEGEGEAKVATFSNEYGAFSVYRFRNRWAYGSSAEPFRLLQA